MVHERIVFEDEFLVVVDKPTGLLVVPTPRKEEKTLTSLLTQYLKMQGLVCKAYPCHRLDRETSGLVVFSKGKSIQKKMMGLFFSRQVRKRYIALVRGRPPLSSGWLKGYIPEPGRCTDKRHRAFHWAETSYRVLESFPGFSMLELFPLTGRTNQLRLQLKRLGHPILGERKFAFAKDFPVRFKRLALHAQGLEFKHPVTGRVITLKALLPKDMEEFLRRHQT